MSFHLMIKPFLLFAFTCLLSSLSVAQVTFTIQSLPDYTPSKYSIYIAGDFTGWQPGGVAYMLHKNSFGKLAITLPAQNQGKVLQYKFTRGTWETVEKGPAGEEISNRIFTFGNGSSVDVTISNWADHGTAPTSTAAANVKVISTNFAMPQLSRTRRIWMYFPPDYDSSANRYPVIYMHDGQNLFDVLTSYAGEWSVDEALNTLAKQGKRVPIVVGIDNGGADRIGEYTPWYNAGYGGGDGEKYLQFIVETLKPYIDQHYHTLPDRENTAIMGSSLGGLISHYGALAYQNTFSKAGLFSPSYWFSDSVWTFTAAHRQTKEMRIYQLCGTNEVGNPVGDMLRMSDSLVKAGFLKNNIFNKVIEGGQHNELLWRTNFTEAYLWLFNSFATGISKPIQKIQVTCIPNPSNREITICSTRKILFDSVCIYTTQGNLVKQIHKPKQNKIDIQTLKPGTYIIKCFDRETESEGKFVKN